MTPRPDQQGIAKMLQPTVRNLLLAGMALFAANTLGLAPANAADQVTVSASTDGATQRSVKVGLNKSLIIDLPRDARDILVSNPVIADAVIRTPRRIYVTGVAIGQSNVIIFDRGGQEIVSLDMEVERDSSTLASMLTKLLPDSDINVEIVSDNIVLSGSVRNAADSRKAQDIATIFGNGGSQAPQNATANGTAPTSSVVNMLNIEGEDQVQLKITVAEVNRTLAKQLGVQVKADNISIGGIALAGGTNLVSLINGDSTLVTADSDSGAVGVKVGIGGGTLTAAVGAKQKTGLVKVLAEPTLTAISGESASFLAGGQFGYLVDNGANNASTFTFKDFGVSLSMTPVVLSDGRISLHMKTEVSEIVAGSSPPSLNVRRAETTLELPSGGSMVLGGLLQDSVSQSINAIPGLGKLPILGPLFRSREFQRNETELVIIATPYLIKPVARDQLAVPGQGLALPSDSQSVLFGKLNRVYGGAAADQSGGKKYQGSVGYIYQ